MLTNVQVTFSPPERSMLVIGDPSEQVALCSAQVAGRFSAREYPEPARTLFQTFVLGSGLFSAPSSSSVTALGLRPPPAVKEKSRGSSGCASTTSRMLPGRLLTNEQYTRSS